jgi:hypothetical protein
VIPGSGSVVFSPPSGGGMVQYACAGVCLARGGGEVVEPRAFYHAIVCQSLLEGRRENPPQWCVLWSSGSQVLRGCVLGYYFLLRVGHYEFWPGDAGSSCVISLSLDGGEREGAAMH